MVLLGEKRRNDGLAGRLTHLLHTIKAGTSDGSGPNTSVNDFDPTDVKSRDGDGRKRTVAEPATAAGIATRSSPLDPSTETDD